MTRTVGCNGDTFPEETSAWNAVRITSHCTRWSPANGTSDSEVVAAQLQWQAPSRLGVRLSAGESAAGGKLS